MTWWTYWRLELQRAYKRTLASLREVGYKNIYAACGLIGLAVAVGLNLWVLLPSPPFIPQNKNQASITCREGENLCDPLEYTVNLFPDPNSENVLVTVYTSRLSLAATRYFLHWPGKILPSETASGPDWLMVKIIAEDAGSTEIEVKGRDKDNEEPRPPLERLERPQPVVDHDRFDFVWVNGKETMSFTDRRLRLGLSTELPLFDQLHNTNPALSGHRQGKVSMEASFVGSQQLSIEAPKASDPEGRPDVQHGAITRDYPGADYMIVVYTEINMRTLSRYIDLIAGVLIGMATNLLIQHFVQVAEAWRRQEG